LNFIRSTVFPVLVVDARVVVEAAAREFLRARDSATGSATVALSLLKSIVSKRQSTLLCGHAIKAAKAERLVFLGCCRRSTFFPFLEPLFPTAPPLAADVPSFLPLPSMELLLLELLFLARDLRRTSIAYEVRMLINLVDVTPGPFFESWSLLARNADESR
jgi:hypothetical protein